ncbi:hypothetical protein AAE02nite_28700 [Adhaeribacter aerolatus]|uniref:Uncharacterized protein n=1 Tax=Adhaeribacter aerolatus TaxID=670289 RepID=A0A512AZS1_9BACT|nr:hypothetical protein [Adhaeribacter aerolatus]GEO05206.1 hypothetical protein AAE02nite_28700 [Adhaeribacter aerolatus]
MGTEGKHIFTIAEMSKSAIFPPEQVFKCKDFDFLLTIGGHLVEGHAEYSILMDVLKELGEREFTIKENLEPATERTVPFKATFSVESNLDEFNEKIKEHDPYFGMMPYHFFVFGKLNTWGIYIAEFPTVNIIGCKPHLVDKFRGVFKIKGNGYDELEAFLDQEFTSAKGPEMKENFLFNYRLIKTHHNN